MLAAKIYASFSCILVSVTIPYTPTNIHHSPHDLIGGSDTLELLALLSGLDELSTMSGVPGAGLCRALAVAEELGFCEGEDTRAIGSRGGTSAVANCKTCSVTANLEKKSKPKSKPPFGTTKRQTKKP